MRFVNNTVITLPPIGCAFLGLKHGSYDCECTDKLNSTVCILCPLKHSFFSDESLNDYYSAGHLTSLSLCLFTFLVGGFGFFANLLIILILRHQKRGRVFDTLLTGLAFFDLMWSAASVISSVTLAFYIGKWGQGRGPLNLECFLEAHYFALFCRTGSSFMTILIAFERYIVVSNPVKAAIYITPVRVRVAVIFTGIFSLLIGLPQLLSMYVDVRITKLEVSTAQDIKDLVIDTPLGSIWREANQTIPIVNQIDYWLPFPLLLLFNGLIYREVDTNTSRG